MEVGGQGETEDSLNANDNAIDNNNETAKRQTTQLPRIEDDVKNGDMMASELHEDIHGSARTTPEVPDEENAHEEVEEGEKRSASRPESTTTSVSPSPVAYKGNGLAGSTPCPRGAQDDDIVEPPVDDLKDEAVEDTQNITSSNPHEEYEEKETDQHGQVELPSNDPEDGPINVTASNDTPSLETSGGALYTTGTFSRKPLPLTINKVAIENSARFKLPLVEAKGRIVHLGRHTEASSQKIKKWYKGDNYVDKDSYSWRNMPLFDDFQRHLYTSEGAARTTFKK